MTTTRPARRPTFANENAARIRSGLSPFTFAEFVAAQQQPSKAPTAAPSPKRAPVDWRAVAAANRQVAAAKPAAPTPQVALAKPPTKTAAAPAARARESTSIKPDGRDRYGADFNKQVIRRVGQL